MEFSCFLDGQSVISDEEENVGESSSMQHGQS
jgi:hypothetical protein